MGKKYSIPLILAVAALVFHLFAGFAFIRSAAPTYDETVHLSSGYSYLSTGLYRMNVMDHPPLSEMLSALPLLALKAQSFAGHPYFANLMPYHYGDLFLYQNGPSPERLLNTARGFTFLIWTALLGLFIWLFVSKLISPDAALLSMAAAFLMPVFISNDALVTTDAAAAVFYFGSFALAWRFIDAARPAEGKKPRPGALWGWAAAAGFTAGLGMAGKFSLFIVPPLALAGWAAHNHFSRRMPAARLAGFAAAYLGACLLAVALVYKGDLGLYYDGLKATLTRLDQGRSSFAAGRYGVNGVWWYFPFALAVKTPLLTLFFVLAGVWAALKPFRRRALWLLLPPAFFLAVSLNTKVQIGYRHIMPVMPFLAVLAGAGLASAARARVGGWVLAGWFALTALSLSRAEPFYLAYFNELAGGPANGYKVLVDSNLDWGQDVKALGSYLKGQGNPPVIFSYFGVARPERYGINYAPLGVVTNAPLDGGRADVCAMKRPLLAVSATNLQGTYYADHASFAWLKDRKPLHVAGYSIFLYDLSGDKDGLERLAALFDREGRNAEADCLYAQAGK